MAGDNAGDLEIDDLIGRFENLSIGPKIHQIPPELLIKVFKNLDLQSLQNVRLSSCGLLPAADTAMLPNWRSTLDQCHSAATAIYDYLLPEGESLPEYSDVNKRSYQPPRTALTIQVAASLMKVIPEKQGHLVSTVLSIKDDHIRAESLDALALHHDRFEKAKLEPVVDEALRLSAIPRDGSILTNPSIPAYRVLRRTAERHTSEQRQEITQRKETDWRFRREIADTPLDDGQAHSREKAEAPALKTSEVNHHAIMQLGHHVIGQDHYRIEKLVGIAQSVSETAEQLATVIRSMSEASAKPKAAQISPARDFSGRAPRGVGRAD